MGPSQVASTEAIKALRVQADALIQAITDIQAGTEDAQDGHNGYLYNTAFGSAYRAATEAKMWLGKMLEGKGNPFPAELADKAKVQ